MHSKGLSVACFNIACVDGRADMSGYIRLDARDSRARHVAVVNSTVDRLAQLQSLYALSKSHTDTTNGLRHSTQCGVPVRKGLVTVCVRMRGDAGQVK